MGEWRSIHDRELVAIQSGLPGNRKNPRTPGFASGGKPV
jgi:hypothetical protein